MTLIATREDKLGNLIKNELFPQHGYCRKVVQVLETADKSYEIGTVLGEITITTSATAEAGGANVGDGTISAIVVDQGMTPGTYNVLITEAATDAGTFTLGGPDGLIGTGTVGVEFNQGGFTFTISDGSTDFEVNDTFTITVVGGDGYKIAVETATDGSEVPAAIVIEDVTVPANVETSVAVLYRGPVYVAKEALKFDASFDDQIKLNDAYAVLDGKGMKLARQV